MGVTISKYKKRAKGILSFMNWFGKPLSRVELLEKFREEILRGNGVNTNERALNYLVQNKKIKKYYSKKGRIMFLSVGVEE